MNKEPEHKESDSLMDPRIRLAYERTYLGHERTQMGWMRTALSFISFGFAIAKFYEILHEKQGDHAPFLSPEAIGVLMIVIGLVAMMLARIQHRRALKLLRERCPDLPPSVAGITEGFIALLGILALLGAILR